MPTHAEKIVHAVVWVKAEERSKIPTSTTCLLLGKLVNVSLHSHLQFYS